jgi:mRNA interferase MazF
MQRGDLVSVAIQGDFGKPRPALVIQSSLFANHTSVTVLLTTSTLVDAPLMRVTVQASASNGLEKTSQIMIDKAMTLKREKIGSVLGCVNADELTQVERGLAVFLGIAK